MIVLNIIYSTKRSKELWKDVSVFLSVYNECNSLLIKISMHTQGVAKKKTLPFICCRVKERSAIGLINICHSVRARGLFVVLIQPT